MDEAVTTELAVGDQVRVHFHRPGPWTSFFEGIVRRLDVRAPEGGYFVVEVRHEVILDREHRVRPGFQDYVRYEDRNDFPGRIEILSTAAEAEREPALDPISVKPMVEAEQEANEQHQVELEVHAEPEIEQAPEAATGFEPTPVDVEPQPARKPRGLMAALFGRR
jgi:hypothetical protein